MTCDLCEKRLKESGHLTSHKWSLAETKPFKCNLWEKRCITSHKWIHTEAKQFKCDLCETGFSISDYWTKHKISHTGAKPLKCDLCHKIFTSSRSLPLISCRGSLTTQKQSPTR